jgi:intein-encoded DNA endonuclease-like protein
MKKGKLKYLIRTILISTVSIWYKNIKPSANQSDIVVEAMLELNNTDINNYDEYLLNIKIAKNKNCQVAVYPYIEGLGNMNFSKVDL